MKEFIRPISLKLNPDIISTYSQEEILYFDIQTTGFAPEKSTLYLIGCVYFENGEYFSRQWFVDEPAFEMEAIDAFMEFIKGFKALVHSGFYEKDVKCKAGVEKFLAILKMEGVSMYVATASDRPLVEKGLRTAGIDHYFKGIITCEEAGAGKGESPKIYEYAMKRLQGNKLNTVIFEDSWAAIRTAKNAGFRVAGIYDDSMADHWEEIKAMADYAYESFEELTESR